MNAFMDDYSRGMVHLVFVAPGFAHIVRKLGYPEANPAIPTARVVLSAETKTVAFQMNPEFIAPLDDAEIAAVISHETMHVVLEHLQAMGDRASYPVQDYLVKATECIINDSLTGIIGSTVGPYAMHGVPLFDQDFSIFSTRQGYDFVAAREAEKPQNEDESDSEDASEASAGESGSGSGSGAGSAGAPTPPAPADGGEKPEETAGEADAEDADGSAADSAPEDAQGEDASAGADGPGEGEPAPCGGVIVDGDLSADEVRDIMGKLLDEAIFDVDADDLPATVAQAMEESGHPAGGMQGSNAPAKGGFSQLPTLGTLSLNWLPLLRRINPRVMSSGARKTKDSWRAPRRRMLSSYPKVILPQTVRVENAKNKGNELPTLILALDMSPSIPHALLKDLASIATSIPEKHIRALPITWSSDYRIFNPASPREIVRPVGTIISTVMNYADEIKRQTGEEPYVVVITDGAFNYSPLKTRDISRWTWMGLTAPNAAYMRKSLHGFATGDVVTLAEYS